MGLLDLLDGPLDEGWDYIPIADHNEEIAKRDARIAELEETVRRLTREGR